MKVRAVGGDGGSKPAGTAFRVAEAAVFARYGLTARSRQVRLVDPAITLRIVEVGAGEPVLLLHGISLGTGHWAPLIAGLPGLRCIAVDMPGHGESGGIGYDGVDLRRWHTTMLSGLLDELALDAAHLIGHSYGGMFGLWLALDAPQRVRSVTSFGAPSVALGARPDWILRMLAAPGIGSLVLAMPTPRSVYRRLLATSLGEHAVRSAPPELIRATYLGTRRRGFSRTVSTYLREQFRGVRSRPVRYVLQDHEVQSILRPVLFIWGERDRYQAPAEGRQRAAVMPDARFEVVPGGHEPWLDGPQRCARITSDFLTQVSGRRQLVQP